MITSTNRLWPTLYLSGEVLQIYSATLNLLVTSLTVPRRIKLKTEMFSSKQGKAVKTNNGFRVVHTDNALAFYCTSLDSAVR